MMMAQALEMVEGSIVLKFMDAPTSPKSRGIITNRQNHLTCFSTFLPI